MPRAWLPTSELSTDPNRENQERSGFVARCKRPDVIRIRICLIGAVLLFTGLAPVGAAIGADADAGAGADAEAPPPLSKPPKLINFVEAERPASLADDQRADV